jgi:hypothetical protein
VEEASVEISPPTALPVTKPMTVDEMALILADVARSADSMRVRAEAIRLMNKLGLPAPPAPEQDDSEVLQDLDELAGGLDSTCQRV